METSKLLFIADSGHGWLRVSKTDLGGFKPSQYSYFDTENAYLEEDCDITGWLKHNRLEPTILAGVKENYIDGQSKVRQLNRF